MRSLTRDILISLTIKLLLLTALWIVCFKNPEKTQLNMSQRLLGSITSPLPTGPSP